MPNKQCLAECVGLWLAEGNNKCDNELTFTNSSPELIKHFHKTLAPIYPNKNIRVYTYSKTGNADSPINNVAVKRYFDTRARKPYFIWRLASVEVMRKWKLLVSEFLQDISLHADILRGFFAGEGNIKTGEHNNRTLRIAQKQQKEFIDNLLTTLGITSVFRGSDRAYDMTGKWNWDIFHRYKLADLHPDKKQKFHLAYNTYKEAHYRAHHIRDELMRILVNSHTTEELSHLFNRSSSRIAEILIELKKKRLVKVFRVRSKSYWILTSQATVIISSIKQRYLNLLDRNPHTTTELAKCIRVTPRSVSKRLRELEKLKLITRDGDKKWKLLRSEKKITVI
ncbi:MAG: winged helix-turn-helix domain-containing protein [Candidatus Woesearchaeota archaeon]|nr:winged helix-turn-helix domain-containing protein [Candidatus Woesearchaeota archaeon]